MGVQHADGGAAPLGQAEAGWDFFECSQAVLQPTLGYKLWNKSFSLDKLAARGNGMHIVGDALHHIEEVAAGRLPVDVLVAFPTCTYVCKLARVWRRRKRLEYTNGRSVAFATARLLLQNPQLDALGVEVFVENPADSEIAQVVGPPAQVVSPWQFGRGVADNYEKPTGIWMNAVARQAGKRVKPLFSRPGPGCRTASEFINSAKGSAQEVHYLRSRTPPGLAAAIARDLVVGEV